MEWLLEEGARLDLQSAMASGSAPTAAQQAEFEARAGAEGSILTVVGSNSEIPIRGILTQRPNFLAMLFGGGNTTYPDIIAALASADADPAVESITLAIDSPGGQVEGMFDAIDAVRATKKPVRAVVGAIAASAAYAIAAQAETITVTNRASAVGSIGVVASVRIREDVVEVASTKAPKKRPDAKTEAGRAIIRERVDETHDIFVDAIAEGRSISVDAVNTDFGQGATVLAEKALSQGMIDAIAGGGKQSGGDDQKTEAGIMDIETLKATHPGTYAAAVAVGVADGVKQERDRASAHLIMGASSGAVDTAVAAVKDGSDMTATLQAEYMSAGMGRKDVSDRTEEGKETDGANGATPDPKDNEENSGSEEVFTLVEQAMGVGDNNG